jgi:hypothetical protein
MLKIYSKENYSDWTEFKQSLVNELKEDFLGHDVTYDGFLMTVDNIKFDVVQFNAVSTDVVKVYFEDGTYLVMFPAVKSGKLILNEEDNKVFKEIAAIYEEAKIVHEEELKEAAKKLEEQRKIAYQEYLKREAERAELLKAKEEERKYQARIYRALKKLDQIRPEKTERLFNSPSTYYEAIGWMTAHATSVRAAMPDYMEKWFDSKFDCDFKYVVDSRKRTSGGHPVQWGLSFRMSFDQAVSGILEQRATSQNKKVIDNVAFVWDLIENYGFQFRKDTQDIERIRAEIPKEYISDFEKGLEM